MALTSRWLYRVLPFTLNEAICSQCFAHPVAKFRHTPPGVVRELSNPSGAAHRESAHSWAVGYVCGGYGRNRHGRAV